MANLRVVAMLAAFLCTATSSWAQSRMSVDSEVRLGRQLAQEFESRVTLNDDPDGLLLADRVGQLLTRNSKTPAPIVFKVIDSDDINVFTFTGSVYVTKGLIAAASSEAEFAFALAHAVALQASQTSPLMLGSHRQSLFPAPELNTFVILTSSTPLLTSLLAPQLARQQENVLAADKMAIQILYNAGYSTSASTSLLQTVEARSAASKSGPYSTHPRLSERIKKSQQWTQAKSRSRDTEVLTTAQFDEVRQRLCQCSK